jgi:dipeptidase E
LAAALIARQQFTAGKEPSMIAFLTSSPFREDADRPTFSNLNGFVDRIRACLPAHPRCLYICSSPDRPDLNCLFGADVFMAFANCGIHFSSYQVLDNTNVDRAGELVKNADLIVLAGGHVPTQNAFFQKIGLRRLLQNHPGVAMGISAGSMNSADVVYAQPEEPGESAPDFQRFLPGLGLSKVQVLPHYQKVKDLLVDDMRLYEDITYADSVGQTFYALPDFSYIVDDGRFVTLFGEGYRIQNGILERLTSHGDMLRI